MTLKKNLYSKTTSLIPHRETKMSLSNGWKLLRDRKRRLNISKKSMKKAKMMENTIHSLNPRSKHSCLITITIALVRNSP